MGLLDALKDPDFYRGLLDNTRQLGGGLLAGTIGAPVDIATMMMRPFGYKTPDKNVVGSSEQIAGLLGLDTSSLPYQVGSLLPNDPTDALKYGGLLGAMAKKTKASAAKLDGLYGLPLNADGTVTLYHATTKEGADAIRSQGALKSAGEPSVYLTTAKDGTGYGDGSVVAVRVDPKLLRLDDEFPGGRRDFAIDVRRPGGKIPVKIDE